MEVNNFLHRKARYGNTFQVQWGLFFQNTGFCLCSMGFWLLLEAFSCHGSGAQLRRHHEHSQHCTLKGHHVEGNSWLFCSRNGVKDLQSQCQLLPQEQNSQSSSSRSCIYLEVIMEFSHEAWNLQESKRSLAMSSFYFLGNILKILIIFCVTWYSLM